MWQSLYAEFKDRGFTVVAVAMDVPEAARPWIEAANPERPFLLALATHPDVELTRGGRVQRCHVEPMPNPAGHRHVRELLARKYGWADRWIGFLTDTSRSVAVRLGCE